MARTLNAQFFDRQTLRVARELLGKFLVRKRGKRRIEAMVTEVEAYAGHDDLASHASRGKTERTKVMFGRAGIWYVYLVYGMHHCMNIVTEAKDFPAAILIRSVEGVKGPGRVAKYFGVDRRLNARPASRASGLWIEDRGVRVARIARGKRIGVDYAGIWKDKPWRFVMAERGKRAVTRRRAAP